MTILTLRLNPRDARKSQRGFRIPRLFSGLHRDRRLDRWMRIVADEFEIFEFEIVDIFDCRIQLHSRQRSKIAWKLLVRLLDVVFVKMQIAKGVNKIAGRKIDNLRNHHREQRVWGDVERDAEKQIGASLIKLAAQLTVLHVKLEEEMARWQRHLVDLSWVPCAHYQAAALWIWFDLCDHIVDLVHPRSVCAVPVAPLRAVDATEIAGFVSPLVPYRNTVFIEITNIGVAVQEPEQLVNDRFDVQLFCR